MVESQKSAPIYSKCLKYGFVSRCEPLEESALEHPPLPLWAASPQFFASGFGGGYSERSARSLSRATEGDISKPPTPENDEQPFWSHEAPRSTDWEDNEDKSQSLLANPRIRRVLAAQFMYSVRYPVIFAILRIGVGVVWRSPLLVRARFSQSGPRRYAVRIEIGPRNTTYLHI